MSLSNFLLIIIVMVTALVFLGCDVPRKVSEPTEGNTKELIRYQTPEVICFRVDGHGGLWCQWKGE